MCTNSKVPAYVHAFLIQLKTELGTDYLVTQKMVWAHQGRSREDGKEKIVSVFILFSLMTARASGANIPSACSGNETLLDCSQQYLTGLPSGIPNSVTNLDMSKNYLHILRENEFRNLSKLVYLTLSDNGISTYEEKAFEALKELRVLRLNTNNFPGINRSLLSGAKQLQICTFSHNSIIGLAEDVFLDNLKLSRLELNSNLISEINNRTFCHLTKLKFLNLSHNRIKYLTNQLFCSNADLEELYIQHNNITRIDINVFRNLHNLSILNMSHNKLNQLGKDTFVDLTSLETLDMSYNEFITLPFNLFITNHVLTILDLSYNTQIEINDTAIFLCNDNIRSLYLKNCNLELKSVYSLNGLERIKKMHYGDNKNCEYLRNVTQDTRLTVICIAGLQDRVLLKSPVLGRRDDDYASPTAADKSVYDYFCTMEQNYSPSTLEEVSHEMIFAIFIPILIVLSLIFWVLHKRRSRNMNNVEKSSQNENEEIVALNL